MTPSKKDVLLFSDHSQKLGRRAELLGILVNGALLLFKGVLCVLTQSGALFADTVNSFTDTVSALLVRLCRCGLSREREEQVRREELCAFAVSLLMLLGGLSAAEEAVGRLFTLQSANWGRLFYLLPVFALAKLFLGFCQRRASREGLATFESLFVDSFVDAASSLGMFFSVCFWGGAGLWDGLICLALSFVLVLEGFRGARRAFRLLSGALGAKKEQGEEMKKDSAVFSEARARFAQSLESHPIPMLATDEAGHVLWMNYLCRRSFRPLRLHALLPRRVSGGTLPDCGEAAYAELFGERCFVLAERVGELRLYCLQSVREAFFAEFCACLSEYEDSMLCLMRESVSSASAADRKEHARYLRALGEQLKDFSFGREFLQASSLVRDVKPGRVFAVSAGEMLRFFSEQMRAPLLRCGSSLTVSCEKSLVALVNFRDCFLAFGQLVNFFLSFAQSKKLSLVCTPVRDGRCTFSFSGEDPYDLLSLYRGICRANNRASLGYSALFFPLFCALNLFSAYRHPVRIFHSEGRLFVEVTVNTTLEFPLLVVREGEAFSEELLTLLPKAECLLYPEGFSKCLGRLLEAAVPADSLVPPSAREVKLFD